MRSLDDAIEWLYGLHVGVIGTGKARHEKPHKPVLLLAVLDLLAGGQATPDRIPWSQALRARFSDYFEIVRTPQDQCTPENPFRRLRTDAFWDAVEILDCVSIPLNREPLVGECNTGKVLATLTGGLERFVVTSSDRLALRHALVQRFFPHARDRLEPLFREGFTASRAAELSPDTADGESLRSGRNSAFRRKILEIYDCQCAACGLRIRMPEVSDLTFVDAAHIIPFNVEPNDHPSNGLALCKNHHWAMDRFLIAPGPDGFWKSSPRLIAHRSPGERELATLAGHPLLPPVDAAFTPAPDALHWRCERLLA